MRYLNSDISWFGVGGKQAIFFIGSATRVSIHCSRFARTADFNLVKNQSRGHAKKVKCSSTSKRVRAYKSRQKTLRLDTYTRYA